MALADVDGSDGFEACLGNPGDEDQDGDGCYSPQGTDIRVLSLLTTVIKPAGLNNLRKRSAETGGVWKLSSGGTQGPLYLIP